MSHNGLDAMPDASLPKPSVSLVQALEQLGVAAAQSGSMAAQLEKRARQLSEREGRTYEEALAHLLGLMRQGWAARERGL